MNPQSNDQAEVFSTLDVRGMVCSKPVIKIKIQLKKMKSSEILEVIATENNFRDLKRLFGESMGHQIIEIREEDQIRLLITKS